MGIISTKSHPISDIAQQRQTLNNLLEAMFIRAETDAPYGDQPGRMVTSADDIDA
jgi:uncharacterized protein YheU (UPF0270 family)